MPIKYVLFDLDGTIVNTNELIIDSFMHALEANRLAPLTREQMIPHMGTTLEQQMRVFSGLSDVTELEKAYRAYNYEHHDRLIQPFPEVNETMEELRRRGIVMGVVTTKIRPTTLKALEMFDLLQYMEVIVTVNDVEHPKPHPEPVLTALERLQAEPGEAVMVGDSGVDIQSAKAAGVTSIGVAWSLKGEDTLRTYKPDHILQQMSDLLEIVGRREA